MIKAVLFDMNGVIISDESIHESAFKETVKPYLINLSHQNYLDLCAGKTDRLGYESIAKYFKKKLAIDELLVKKAEFYLKAFPSKKKIYDSVIEFIKKISTDYTLAVTSGASKNEIELILNEFKINKYFKVIISADDVYHGKPHPEPYLLTCEKLELQTKECVVIEDSPSGIKSAKEAGCYCIALTTTHQKEELKKSDLIVNSFAEINLELLNEIWQK